jgi:hypothetical protein
MDLLEDMIVFDAAARGDVLGAVIEEDVFDNQNGNNDDDFAEDLLLAEIL